LLGEWIPPPGIRGVFKGELNLSSSGEPENKKKLREVFCGEGEMEALIYYFC